MEKASTVLRRSGVRLRTSLGVSGGHGDLQMVIAQLRDAKASSRALSQSESAAWQDLTKWSLREENRAIQDALCQVGELASVWTEVQKELAEGLRDFRQHFAMILEGERGLDSARVLLEAAEAKELKLKKEIKKAAKRATRSEMHELQDRLSAAEKEKDLAQVEVFDRVREHEVVKMIRVKDGLVKLTQAYVDMAQKCEILFSANNAIAHRIPDVEGCEVQDIKFTGSGSNMRTVLNAKEKIKNFRRIQRSFVDRQDQHEQQQSGRPRALPQSSSDLPPPYSEHPPPPLAENPYYVSLDHESLPIAGASSFVPSPMFSSSSVYPRLNQSLPSYDAMNDLIRSPHVTPATATSERRTSSPSSSRRRSDNFSRRPLRGREEQGSLDDLNSGVGGLNLNLR